MPLLKRWFAISGLPRCMGLAGILVHFSVVLSSLLLPMSSRIPLDEGLHTQATLSPPVVSDRPAPDLPSEEAIAPESVPPVPDVNGFDGDPSDRPTESVASGADPLLDEEPEDEPLSPQTIALAVRDVRVVLQEQREQSQILTTKLNILFVSNGALLTSLTISRLLMIPSLFTVAEMIGFFVSFTLLVRAFLPRQVAVSPNLEDRKFLERYLALSAIEYQLQMLVNWSETYNANKQRLDDVSKTLRLAAYATLSVATLLLVHILVIYVF
jgi:hypothetical protein